jgi:hypothetical protein
MVTRSTHPLRKLIHVPIVSVPGASELISGRHLDNGMLVYHAYHPNYGLAWDNVTDDGPALQEMLDHVGTKGGGRIVLPEGTGRLATGVVLRHDDLVIEFLPSTVVNFDPPRPATLFTLRFSTDAHTVARCGIRNPRIYTKNNNIAKTAFDFVDTSSCWVEGLYCPEGNWDGHLSVIFRLRGREFTRIGPNIVAAAERIFVFDPNPVNQSIGCDHFVGYGPMQLIGRGKAQNPPHADSPVITKNAGCPVTSMQWHGIISLNRGSQGIRWRSTDGKLTDSSQSFDVDFSNFRREQSPNAVGAEQYAIDIDGGGQPVYNLSLGNWIIGGAAGYSPSKGIRLVGCHSPNLGPIFYDGALAALEIGAGCEDVRWESFATTNTASLLNSGDLLERHTSVNSYGSNGVYFPTTGHYVRRVAAPAGYTASEQQGPDSEGGVRHGRVAFASLATGAEARLPVSTQRGTSRLMRIRVVAHDTASPDTIYEGELILTPGGFKLVRGSAGFDAAASAGHLGGRFTNEFRSALYNNTGHTLSGFYAFEFVN